jgi:hypothetical protein
MEEANSSFKAFLVQNKGFSHDNAFSLNEFTIDSKNSFEKFKHIYLINENDLDVQKTPFLDIETTCCILTPSSIQKIPEWYFSPYKNRVEFDQYLCNGDEKRIPFCGLLI